MWFADKYFNVQADGFTAIKSWVIACIVFVFGAMLEYSGILLLVKLEKMNIRPLQSLYRVGGVYCNISKHRHLSQN